MVYDYNDMLMFNGFSGEFACFLVSGLVASRYYNFESNKDQYMTFYKQQELFYPSHEVFDEDHTEEELVVFSDKAIIVVIPEDIMHEYQDKSPFFNEMLREQMAYQLQKNGSIIYIAIYPRQENGSRIRFSTWLCSMGMSQMRSGSVCLGESTKMF